MQVTNTTMLLSGNMSHLKYNLLLFNTLSNDSFSSETFIEWDSLKNINIAGIEQKWSQLLEQEWKQSSSANVHHVKIHI